MQEEFISFAAHDESLEVFCLCSREFFEFQQFSVAGLGFERQRARDGFAARNLGRPHRAGQGNVIENYVNRETPRGFFRLDNVARRRWREK